MTAPPGKLVEISVEGMHCSACVGHVEKLIKQSPGVQNAAVSLVQQAGWIELASQQSADLAPLFARLRQAGYPATLRQDPSEVTSDQAAALTPPARRAAPRWGLLALLAAVATAIVMGLMFIHTTWSTFTQLTLASLCVGASFHAIILPGVSRLVRLRPDMFSLMAAGVLVSWIAALTSFIITASREGIAGLAHLGHGGSAESSVLPLYLDTVCGIIALAALGRWLEERSMGKARGAIRNATDQMPAVALRLVASRPIETPTDSLRPLDHILAPVGKQIAADGVILTGQSQIDESLLTGEAIPATKLPGDRVLGGSINLGPQPLTIEVTASAHNAYVASLERLMLTGQRSKTSAERLADRVSGLFVPAVFALAIIALLAWWLIAGDLAAGIKAMTSVLVAACPCALGLAVPMTMTAASGVLAHQGVLLTDAAALERAGKLRTIALDKTGTLSVARPIVTHVQGSDRSLQAARALARHSLHPVAQAIANSGPSQGIITAISETPGQGMQGQIDGQRITLRRDSGASTNQASLTIIEIDGQFAGSFTLEAPLKPAAAEAVARLQQAGLTCIMLSGDQPAAVESAAKALGITLYYSQFKPEDKLRLIQDLTREQPGSVAMAGDGINDAAALASADVGIAMGTGSDLAKRAGHLILLRDDPRAIADAIDLSRQIMRRIRITLGLAFIYNIILLPVAALGLLSPMLAAGAMALSSVSVIIGSMIGWPKGKPQPAVAP